MQTYMLRPAYILTQAQVLVPSKLPCLILKFSVVQKKKSL